jgi:hypothetical protein
MITMDKFEEKLNELAQMSEEDKNRSLEEIKGDCVCPICPTYNECAEKADELIFCITGKSKNCISEERSCMCPSCPFGQKHGIGVKYNFYCIRDSEIEQRKK